MSEKTIYIVSIAVAGVVVVAAGLYYLGKTTTFEAPVVTTPSVSPAALMEPSDEREPGAKSLEEIVREELTAPQTARPAPVAEEVLKELAVPPPAAAPARGGGSEALARPRPAPVADDVLKSLTVPRPQ